MTTRIGNYAVPTVYYSDLDSGERIKKGKFNTVLGTLSFDKKGDVSLPGYVWYEWSKGNYKQL